MGTNFYLFVKNKSIAEKIGDFELTDTPSWGYLIHIGKRSCGWLPLFQSHRGIKSVKDIEEWCKLPEITILNEYDEEFTWEQLKEELIYWNGGVAGAKPREYHEPPDPSLPYVDRDMPNWTPVSQFDYGNGKYASHYYRDSEGFEFTDGEFC
jgi:hypothetical protein